MSTVKDQDELPTSAVQTAVTVAVLLFLATITTALRIWMVHRSRRPFLPADYMVVVSIIFYYSSAIVTYLALTIGHLGYPLEQDEAQPWREVFLFKIFYYVQISYAIGMGCTKCSIVTLLQSIFATASPTFRRVSWVVLGLCTSWSVMVVLIAFLNCRPLDYNWSRQSPSGHCGHQNAEFAAVGVVHVATDLMIITLPIPVIWARQLRTSKKIAVICVFALGIFTIAAAVVRIVVIMTTNFETFVQTGNSVIIWSMAEWGVAIMVANAPVLKPLLRIGKSRMASMENYELSRNQNQVVADANESTRSILRGSNELNRYENREDHDGTRSGNRWTIEPSPQAARVEDENNICVLTELRVE